MKRTYQKPEFSKAAVRLQAVTAALTTTGPTGGNGAVNGANGGNA
jgi:hypothetical protein